MSRILLSPPELVGTEVELLGELLDDGPNALLDSRLHQFEDAIARRVDMPHAVAVASGTAALHLALSVLGIGSGDEVWLSTLTYVATANAVAYTGATPVFVDSDDRTWNLDPELLADALDSAARTGKRPRAVTTDEGTVNDAFGGGRDLGPQLVRVVRATQQANQG